MKALPHILKQMKVKKYRDAFIASQFKRLIPFQITVIRKKAKLSQEKLAEVSKLTQGVISRAENPDYGNLTVNTILRIAAGFNMGFKGEFVPLSELVTWVENLSEQSVQWKPFEGEEIILANQQITPSEDTVVLSSYIESHINMAEEKPSATAMAKVVMEGPGKQRSAAEKAKGGQTHQVMAGTEIA